VATTTGHEGKPVQIRHGAAAVILSRFDLEATGSNREGDRAQKGKSEDLFAGASQASGECRLAGAKKARGVPDLLRGGYLLGASFARWEVKWVNIISGPRWGWHARRVSWLCWVAA
jgi:hypothetical protein